MNESQSIAQLVQAVGVPVAICLAMLYAFAKWIVRMDEKADKKDEAHRAEREQTHAAFTEGLDRITSEFKVQTEVIRELATEQRETVRAVTDNGKMLEDVLDDQRRGVRSA